MPNFNSPGVYVIEKDISTYPANIDSSVVGIVGFANKGPVNKATLVTSQESLLRTFGNPSESIPGQGLEGSLEVLETTDNIFYVRAVSGTALEASATIPIGGCPAVQFVASGFGVSSNVYLSVQVTNASGTNQFTSTKLFDVVSGVVTTSANQGQAMKGLIGGATDSAKVSLEFDGNSSASGYLVGSWAGSGATLSVTAYEDSSRTTGVSAFEAVDANGDPTGTVTSAIVASGTSILSEGASSCAYSVQSLYPGTGYILSTNSAGNTVGNSIEIDTLGNFNTRLQVNADGFLEEDFKVNLVGSGSFVEDVINTGNVDETSEFVKGLIVASGVDIAATKLGAFTVKASNLGFQAVQGTGHNVVDAGVNPRFVKFVEGTYGMTGGTDGFSSDSDEQATVLIGDSSTNPKTGMQVLDDDVLNISIAMVPGVHTQTVQNALVTLAETSMNFLAVVSPPRGAIDTTQEAIDWSNGNSETRTTALNSSWAAIYWPHVKVFSTFTGADQWFDPAIFAVRQMAYTDDVGEAWFAPAGFIRGRLTKPTEVEVKLNQGDRDSLYSGGNVVNPIVNFPQRGIAIWGQRTSQRDPTALDRVNVRRLMIYLRKVLLLSSQRFVFDPNDPILWEQIKGVVEPLLMDVQNRRGITDFAVVCDETVNTPVRIDRNEVWCKVILKPTKAAEIVVFELNITNQSAQIGS